MLYTEPRYTKALDIWVETSPANAEKVFRALAACGAPLKGLSASDFAEPGTFYQFAQPPVRVDILMSIDGLTFEEAWPNREQFALGLVEAWVIGRNDLIRNKRATGRHIDLHDADLLGHGA